MEVPVYYSWVWRGILQVRKCAKPFTKYLIANGEDTQFWHEPWTDKGVLRELVSSTTKQLCGIREVTFVKDAMTNHHWKPVPQNHLQVMELWSAVQNTSIYEEEEKDQIVWSPHPKGIFSTSTAYAAMRRSRNIKVDWTRVVWHKTSIPRQSFKTWLAVIGKLDTQDRLLSWGVLKVSVCVLCSNKDLREKLSTTGTSQGTTAGRITPCRNNKWPFICSKEHYKSKANT
ncbi:RNA-directed DNA polymerase (reverse transcriptase)-related family protein, partial [Thalictrum thalictroides]